MGAEREMTVFTHHAPEQTASALALLVDQAAEAGVRLRFDSQESARHRLSAGGAILTNAPVSSDVELCLVLGGDGTILRALQHYAHTGVPVFAVNFGEVGFLASIGRDDLPTGLGQAFAGEFELLRLPALTIDAGAGVKRAINDLAVHRKAGERVARLSYALNGCELGSVRCDGLVVATAAGSTGYNLANGGPVMAWGVRGYVISFIAPHSLTARALVAAPGDTLAICNRSREVLEITIDGRPVGELAAGGSLQAGFEEEVGLIAQLPGYSFYGRLREKFGLLAR